MQTTTLGNSDLRITPTGFGAWAIGGTGYAFAWGPQDDDQSIASIHKALDLGINWIDTAAVYGLGHSEEVVARALSGRSGQRPHVFTKCGLVWDNRHEVKGVIRGDSIRRECEQSLKRLRIDAIDLYQIHWPTDNIADIDGAWTTLAELQREGKVRWIGVSNFDVAQLERAQAIAPVTSLQPPYSMLRRDIEDDILPFCESHGIGVIAYSPMQSGLLSGAFTRERAANLPKDDWRGSNAEYQEPRLSQNLTLVDRLREIGERHGRSPGEVAIAWTLRNPAVTAAIVGARSPEQVEGFIGAAHFRLAEGEIAGIEQALAERDATGAVL